MTAEYVETGFGHACPAELDRLHTVEAMCDPFSTEWISELMPQPTWECADLGAGAGSLARWLVTQVPNGSVTATDIDTRFLAYNRSDLRIIEHDIRVDDFPPDCFDLIHLRLVLEYLPNPDTIVRRTVVWLKSDGWLVVEGVDLSAGAASPHPPVRKVVSAILDHMRQATDSDIFVSRRAGPLMVDAGLSEIDVRYQPLMIGDHGAVERCIVSTVDSLASVMVNAERITLDELAEFRSWLELPGRFDVIGMLVWTCGRRRDIQ